MHGVNSRCDVTHRKEMTLPESSPSKPYLVDNNPRLDMTALEQRLDAILVERHTLPTAPRPLPSLEPAARPSLRRRLLIRLKGSYLVSQWLPRHPGLYRRARTLYHWLRAVAGRR